MSECRATAAPVIVLDAVDSTNAEALRRAAAGVSGPLWVRAERQTAGRGRSGRGWMSEPGNLYASLLLPLACRPEVIPQLSLVAGVGVLDAVAAVAGGRVNLAGLRLKWPNDVLFAGAKLAGILSESTTAAGGQRIAVIGIGINLAGFPDDLGRRATCLAAHGVTTDSEQMLRHLAFAVDHWLEVWDNGAGFDAVRRAWLMGAGPPLEPMSVTLSGGATLTGQYGGLDTDGALLIHPSGGGPPARITFGDVTLTAGSSGEDNT